ncbi:hypothetical protein Trydic_g1731 [Trypoxylus dichotomus]
MFKVVPALMRKEEFIRADSSLHNLDEQTVMVRTNHPKYNARTINNDIAILEVATNISLGASVAAIILADEDYSFSVGVGTIVSGWGTLSVRGDSPIQLQAVTIPIFEKSICVTTYAEIGLPVTETMICAGYADGGRDAWQGDSDGPLVTNGKLLGVVS